MAKTFSASNSGAPFIRDGNISRRGLLGGALGVAAGIGLAACGAGSAGTPGQQASAPGGGGAEGYDGPPVSLAYWNGLTGGDGPVMKKMMDNFNKEHPNIKVSMTAIAWADYYQKVPAAVSNGKGPDVGIMHEYSLATNAARQVLQPLDDVASALGMQESDFSPLVWAAGLYKGPKDDNPVRYGIPLDLHPAGLYYNKTVLEKIGADPEKPPTTGDELIAILDKAKSKNIQGMWTSALSVYGLEWQTLVYQFGGKMVNDDGLTVGFGDEPAVKALTWWKDLIDKGYSPKNAAANGNDVSFQNDKAAFMINGPWMTTPLSDKKGLKWGAAPVPKIGDSLQTWSGAHHFVLPRQKTRDENKLQASRVFVNWMSQQSLAWATAGMVPARKSVRESPEFAKLGAVTQFAKELDYVNFVPAVPGIQDIDPVRNAAVSEAMLGKKDIATALGEAAEKANKILAANAEKYGG
ncbi:MAG TPA: ABC transporter substrate-binding protein [Propionibacteriaceae bacterium]|nr:ABC transporter substrate-binding protein [Propionibacteriaceae bacterium]